MESIKPTKSGFAAIAVPHKKQTEYLIDGVPNVRTRVGATGKLGFSLSTFGCRSRRRRIATQKFSGFPDWDASAIVDALDLW